MPIQKSAFENRNSKSRPRAALLAIGCRLNQTEAALLADQLRTAGFDIVPWEEPAELLVVNSCTVTAAAAAKTRNAVRAARKRNPDAFIALTGCDATVAAEAWAEDRAAVDLILPNPGKHDLLAEVAKKRMDFGLRTSGSGHTAPTATPPHRHTATPFVIPATGHFTGRTRANLKIQEGCNVGCSYCIIPKARGAPKSRDWDDTLREVRELAARGHREIILTGINLALYDAGHGRRLPELAREILRQADGFRLRLSSLEPGPELPRIVEFMAAEPRVCRHLHLPLQYADDRILAAMHRPYTLREYAEFARDAVRHLPGLCLGTDIITGFPGETDEIFADCHNTLAALPLAYFHVFTFSPRPGTMAAALPGRVHGDIASQRQKELEALSKEKAEAFVRSRIGQPVEVLVENRRHKDDPPHGTSSEFLEITITNAQPDLRTNTLVRAHITAATGNRSASAEFAGISE